MEVMKVVIKLKVCSCFVFDDGDGGHVRGNGGGEGGDGGDEGGD